MMRFLLLSVVVLLLAGCEAQSTPIANIATSTAISAPTAIPVDIVRYGIATNLAPYAGDIPVAYDVVAGNSVPGDYDLIVSYGVLDGWEQSPQVHRVSLVINPNLAPLDISGIRDLIPAIIDRQTIIADLNINGAQQTTAQTQMLSAADIRTTLANAGFPDGFQMTLATEKLPGIENVLSQFGALSLDLRVVPLRDDIISANQAHLGLFLWAEGSERTERVALVGEENVIDLWTMPISYLAAETLPIEFTADGIPFPVE